MSLDDRSTQTGAFPVRPESSVHPESGAGDPAHRPAGPHVDQPDEPAPGHPAARDEDAAAGAEAPAGGSDPAASARLRERWQEALLSFVDDPRASVRQADGILDDAVAQFTEAVRREQERLRAAWREDGAPSTDTLRDALRGYRDFLERLVSTPR